MPLAAQSLANEWGPHGEFVIDGNLTSVEYAGRLPSIKVPTLITVGDHDECEPSLSRQMNRLITGSKLVVLPKSGHMTFVDQPGLFIEAVQSFLSTGKRAHSTCRADGEPVTSIF